MSTAVSTTTIAPSCCWICAADMLQAILCRFVGRGYEVLHQLEQQLG